MRRTIDSFAPAQCDQRRRNAIANLRNDIARLRQIEASKILRLPYVGDAGLCVDAKLPAMFPQKN
jgi:hypothetical protein